jgi:DNA mismatch repair protein MutL
MSKIKKLSINEAKKIAAGEVVERPYNIVKELIENSIDAESTVISIFIKDGGKKLIRIIDDGFGMSADDAKLCFEHHATSKITTVDDLDKIYTYGFRGEALSSISSVSRVTLITKDSDSKVGTKLFLEDGEIKKHELASVKTGTDISIEDIFYNVPARQKFLKKSETEWRNISHLFQSYCFAYKNIHFKLFNDDVLVFNCPPVKDLKDRIIQVWNLNLSENMLPVLYENKSVDSSVFEINGYISNHQVSQFNKNRIYFFVNNRWVKNFELTKALLKGYKNVLPVGRFPVSIILIKSLPSEVDINVHPRKEEVRLLNSYKIEQSIYMNVKKALEDNLSVQLNKESLISSGLNVDTTKVQGAKVLPFEQSLQLYAENNFEKESDPLYAAARPSDFMKESILKIEQPFTPEFNAVHKKKLDDLEIEELFGSSVKKSSEIIQQVSFEDNFEYSIKYLGQVKKTYLLIENNEGLLVVDQHAAHESVLFDLFSKRFDYISTVKLVFPHIINLQKNEVDRIIEQIPILKKYGIEADRIGATQIVISATPVYLKDASLDDLILQIISWIHDYERLDHEKFEQELSKKICAQMACKAAVKSGDSITKEQAEQLMKDLYKVENRFTCPHGRPTFWSLSTNDIEKKFKRDYKN